MQIQVIRLEASDLALAARLAEIMPDGSPAPTDRLLELLQDRRNIVLAGLRGPDPAAYLVAHQFPSLSGERLVYLYDIEVSRDCRRRGIGRVLVARLLEICRSADVDGIWVGSALDNVAACTLWQRSGAIRVSEQYAEFVYPLSAPNTGRDA